MEYASFQLRVKFLRDDLNRFLRPFIHSQERRSQPNPFVLISQVGGKKKSIINLG